MCMTCMCGKCMKTGGFLLLVFGILFLLQDLNVWNFWGISWYTVVLIMLGISMTGTCSCPECRKLRKK